MRKTDRIVLSAALPLAALGLAAMSRGFDTNGAFSFFGGLVVLILCLGTTVYVTQRNRIPWPPQLFLGVSSILLVFGLDGANRNSYVDLVYFAQRGRNRLAANMLTGLRGLLRDHPRLSFRAPRGVGRRQSATSDLR